MIGSKASWNLASRLVAAGRVFVQPRFHQLATGRSLEAGRGSMIASSKSSSINARSRLYSSTRAAREGEGAQASDASMSSSLMEGSTGKDLGQVVRHGKGDATITLNVGGKEFLTLRSTVNSNPVLADHVARAEANRETVKGTGAVFIDRDPTHFGFVLQYLRNRVELLSYNLEQQASSSTLSSLSSTFGSRRFTETYVQLPEDRKVLRDMYIEACYYRIPELQEALTRTTWYLKIFDVFTDGNPFDVATKWLTRLRNMAVAFATFGTLGTTIFVTLSHDFQELLEKIGIKRKSTGSIKDTNQETSIVDAVQQAVAALDVGKK